jgi:hypothetical protein
MVLSLDNHRRYLRSTFDVPVRAEASIPPPSCQAEAIQSNFLYRRARERERARKAAAWFNRGEVGGASGAAPAIRLAAGPKTTRRPGLSQLPTGER